MSTKEAYSLQTGMLALMRSIQVSEALLWATGTDKDAEGKPVAIRLPIIVQEKGVRGQSSENNAKNEGKSNPQTVDNAVIPAGYDHLEITFSVRVMPGAMNLHASDSPAVSANYAVLARAYADNGGFAHLARRYVANVLNGRFAWRNRWQSDTASVSIRFAGGTEIVADPFALDLQEIPSIDEMRKALVFGTPEGLDALIDGVARGLSEAAFEFDVSWSSKMGPGAEVFPSQEYLRGEAAERLKGRGEDGGKSRVYATLPSRFGGKVIEQASIHSQKIGAALRHIDDWHNNDDFGPIAVNPYGGVQETADVLRASRGGTAPNLYAIMGKPEVLKAEVEKPAGQMSGETHFFFANLIRGGVFGVSTKTAKTAAEA
ncbi:type I-F CRISPR-associated protein Csy3 [Paracoccus liaowanqingii]|uniref:Type I-F CRISPR-associated protein Csy3 n=1 Tax=Paracoccus liaowanqingii TaxID=2560053 RepID=A0A4Z1CT02_9RHOB|nr:type I-F CRISPR-associated protein Csy3 [Paracoccus liaowanqingii]TGN68555.1 type I-F CRISPR-associated protein Csy3 [Paracoccus liaowanqingii]